MLVFLHILQFFGQIRVFIVCVQGITARRQSVAWRGRAIAEGPANPLALDLATDRCLPEKLGIAQYHPAEPDEVDPSLSQYRLRNIAPVGNGDGFPAPDQLAAAGAKTPPPPNGKIGRRPIRSCVPTFHRLHRDPVADFEWTAFQFPAERRLGSG